MLIVCRLVFQTNGLFQPRSGLRRARCEQYLQRLEYTLTPCGFLHWGGLQAPGGTLAAIRITLRRYLPIRPQPRLTELSNPRVRRAAADFEQGERTFTASGTHQAHRRGWALPLPPLLPPLLLTT